jgi:hypothetical protein
LKESAMNIRLEETSSRKKKIIQSSEK